jgi:hypothetical protein
MITGPELSRSLYGAWRLARLDKGGLTFFENSVPALWRSFWAMVIVFPAFMVLILLRTPDGMVAVAPLTATFINSTAYVIGWFAFPLVMFRVCSLIGREDQYCLYIAAYNWAALLQIVLMLGLAMLSATGLLPPGIAAMLTILAVGAILFYQGFIARTALDIKKSSAAGIVLLDFFLGLTIEIWTSRLLSGHSVLT